MNKEGEESNQRKPRNKVIHEETKRRNDKKRTKQRKRKWIRTELNKNFKKNIGNENTKITITKKKQTKGKQIRAKLKYREKNHKE